MKQNRTGQIIKLTGLGIYLAAITLAPACWAVNEAKLPTVSVGVFARHVGDKIMYHYRVNNKTDENITAITIGRSGSHDKVLIDGTLNLLELPSGWNLKFGIPASSYNAPNGWRANLITYDEENPEIKALPHAVKWEILNDKSPMILPGQATSKFSVTLDKADSNYLNGQALVSFFDNQPSGLSVPIDLLDVTPPELTVTLSPDILLSNNELPVAIKATFSVQDEYDSMPQIKLESITAEEPLEAGDILDATLGLDDRYFKLRANLQDSANRVYTVYYSATDASGNQTLASATVTVAPIYPSADNETTFSPEPAQEQNPPIGQVNALPQH